MTSSCNPQSRNGGGHARFVELCALYSSGSLKSNELAQLNDHLGTCQECRTLLADYRALVEVVSVPQCADAAADLKMVTGFDRELAKTKRSLFSQLEHDSAASKECVNSENNPAWSASGLARSTELRYAALVILVFCAALASYVLGGRKALVSSEKRFELAEEERQPRLRPSPANNERNALTAVIERQKQELTQASLDRERQLREIVRLQELLDRSETEKLQLNSAAEELSKENDTLKADHEGISSRLQESQANITHLREQLADLQSESAAFQAENVIHNHRIDELTAQISEQQRLLAADRDIRDLMGARDLLISDVLDIDTKGRDKKPFGRIFYTKHKSLVFYAFDLDKQPGVRNTSTFQAWGAKATSRGNEFPVSMGIFYMDNANAQRWMLKLDDPKLLEQIDSVFVTLEPKGGSSKPSGKQFLFASLRSEANHP
jgi:hypothetical protein